MPALINLIGRVFGRLTVLSRAENYTSPGGVSQPKWLCRCDCPGKTEKAIHGSALLRGLTESCGCLHKELLSKSSTKHGHSRPGKQTRVYVAWCAMKQRCRDKNHIDYHNYGGRGITVCTRWLTFQNFLEDMGEPPSPRHSIDRFPKKDGNYEPGNCRWATAKQQARNTRHNRLITIDGVTHCVSEWAEIKGLARGTIYSRIVRDKMSERDAVMKPKSRS